MAEKKSTTKKKVTEIKKINSSNPKSSSKKPAQSAPKKLKQSSVISLIILFALILVGVVGYLNYKNSVDAVFDYYSTNDQRRSETIYQDFDSEQPKQKTVITRFGLNHLTYSLVHQSTDNNNEIFVETFYLKRSNPIKFEVTKSFRNIVTNKEFDEVVKLARKHDLHLDNPDENQTEIISIRDLDLTPAQQEQATQQQAAQEEQKKAQEEYEALPTDQKILKLEEQVNDIKGFMKAVEDGETTYNGQAIPEGVDPNYLEQVLQGTLNEIERLKTAPEGESAENSQSEQPSSQNTEEPQ